MIATGDAFWAFVKKPNASDGIGVRETNWGFAIQERASQNTLAETIVKLLGLLLVPGIGALVAFASELGATLGVAAQTGMFIAFVLVGLAIYTYASRGLQRTLQVDTAHAEFRLGTVNGNGSFTRRQTYRFADIESIFLMRESGGSTSAKLHLRLKSSTAPIYVLSGPERALAPILERVTESVRGKKGNRRARTKTTGRFVHVTFS